MGVIWKRCNPFGAFLLYISSSSMIIMEAVCERQYFGIQVVSTSSIDLFWTSFQGGYGAEQPSAQIASSPPFFSGSPPSRVANPLIQDARFGDEKLNPISPSIVASPGQSSSPSSSSRKGGCVRANFGDKPAMRVEGFDCMKRDDRRNRSIPALAWDPINRVHKHLQKSKRK